MIPVTANMFFNNFIFVLAYLARSAHELCTISGFSDKLVITVANSTHLCINWENSFKGCDNIEVESTSLKIWRDVWTSEFNTDWIHVNFAKSRRGG